MRDMIKYRIGTICALLVCAGMLLHYSSRQVEPIPVPEVSVASSSNALTQVATIDSLLAGVYDGEMSLKKLSVYGDFGIGTFQDLDGEMVLLNGIFYQVRGDGKVYRPSLETKTPFASVMRFPEQYEELTIDSSTDYETLCRLIDQRIQNANVPVAVYMKGRFTAVRTRSVDAQQRPFRPMVEVMKNQREFDLGTVSGQVVGFRLPASVHGLNVPGCHFHFLNDDLSRGGHVLSLNMEAGRIQIAVAHEFRVLFPEKVSGFASADLSKDRSEELRQVERQ